MILDPDPPTLTPLLPSLVPAPPSPPPQPSLQLLGGEYDELPGHTLPKIERPTWANEAPSPPATPTIVRIGTPRPAPRLAEPTPVAIARAAPPAPRVQGAVEVMSGPERGFSRFVREEVTIGRGRESDIHIASDTQLSRIHCKVIARGTSYFLLDNGSTRGTVVNGRKITEVELKGGEVIMAGRTVFSFKLVEDEPDLSDDATEMAGE
jgi:pSer/pThr/pTyr-binding forkhead associated (FHA) protein